MILGRFGRKGGKTKEGRKEGREEGRKEGRKGGMDGWMDGTGWDWMDGCSYQKSRNDYEQRMVGPQR